MSNIFAHHQTNPYPDHPQALERAANVKLLVLDVDGVLTNGQVWIGADGKESLKAFDIQDGLGMKLLERCNIPTAIITGRNSKMVLARCEELGIQHVHMGVENKSLVLAEILKSLGMHEKDCAVMGDDWPDLAMMKNAGLRIAPAQAHVEVKKVAHLVTEREGGSGAVREVCDLILKAQDRYGELLSKASQ